MQRMLQYSSPIGTISIIADEMGLTGLYFDENMPAHQQICDDFQSDSPILDNTKRWLDIYFSGKNPGFSLPLHPAGSPFQQQVWSILADIPYGKTTTYGEIARQVAKENGIARMSSQAIGGAVGSNPISIIIPCHRVIGADGSMIGYAGGIERKIALLKLEGD